MFANYSRLTRYAAVAVGSAGVAYRHFDWEKRKWMVDAGRVEEMNSWKRVQMAVARTVHMQPA